MCSSHWSLAPSVYVTRVERVTWNATRFNLQRIPADFSLSLLPFRGNFSKGNLPPPQTLYTGKIEEGYRCLRLDNSEGSSERGHRDIPFRWEFCAERFHPFSLVCFSTPLEGKERERHVRSGENGVKPTGFWCHSERMERGKRWKLFPVFLERTRYCRSSGPNVFLPPWSLSFFTKAALCGFSAIDHHLIRRVHLMAILLSDHPSNRLITEKRYSVIYKTSNIFDLPGKK